MRARLVVFLIVGVGALGALLFMREVMRNRDFDRSGFTLKKLRVLTYSTFVSTNGPGGDLIRKFQQFCQCKVDVTSVSDAGLLLERVKVSSGGAPFDLVIGLDQNMLEQAKKFAWREMDASEIQFRPEIEAFRKGDEFLPFDWSPLTFVYRKSEEPVPQNLADLMNPRYKGQFLLQDPRASSPGLQFYNWILTLVDEPDRFLAEIKSNVHSVSPSWAFAYGQFQKKQGRFVFSYLTSLAFHWGVENDRSYDVLRFSEGHPVQVEYAAIPADCRNCELAVQFTEMMLTTEGQTVIMNKNFMLPVLKGVEEGTVYAELPQLKTIPTKLGEDLWHWDQVFAR